jgi:hypothetical protein
VDADIVLVDTPPTLVSDPYDISRAVDRVVIVACLPAIRRATLERLQRTLSTFRAPILGLVRTGMIEGVRADCHAGYRGGHVTTEDTPAAAGEANAGVGTSAPVAGGATMTTATPTEDASGTDPSAQATADETTMAEEIVDGTPPPASAPAAHG